MATDQLKGFHAKIYGNVHGVGFRYSTSHQANRLSIKGYVKNLSDGTVEITAEGPLDKLKQLAEWLKKGPPGAMVSNVDLHFVKYTGLYKSFKIDY